MRAAGATVLAALTIAFAAAALAPTAAAKGASECASFVNEAARTSGAVARELGPGTITGSDVPLATVVPVGGMICRAVPPLP
ncbi:MAG TPA: hypothetical protein VM582_03115 [Candidatus Thermoplasmatota archaeon]|nr:hypothetical protein [Candidatus Thermoplasmatota archaeon]